MALFKWSDSWDPFMGLRHMQRELGRLFENGGTQFGSGRIVGGGVYPPVNLFNGEDDILVECEVPGMKKDQIDLSITGETLVIMGTKQPSTEDENVRYHRSERGSGDFKRTVVLPDKVDAEKISAKLENGILTITLPKSEAAKPRQIAIS